jgi:hypothetical protein
MSGETDVEIYASLTDLDFEFNELRFISLTELAEDPSELFEKSNKKPKRCICAVARKRGNNRR